MEKSKAKPQVKQKRTIVQPRNTALNFEGPVVTVNVGSGGKSKTFRVHQSLLVPRSEFFKKALEGNRKEAKDSVKLPKDDPDLFAIYVHYLYTGGLCCADNPGEEATDAFHGPARLYIFADKILDFATKNGMIDAMFEIYDNEDAHIYSNWTTIETIYASTQSSNHARRLMVDFINSGGDEDVFCDDFVQEWNERCPEEFARELSLSFIQKRDIALEPSAYYQDEAGSEDE